MTSQHKKAQKAQDQLLALLAQSQGKPVDELDVKKPSLAEENPFSTSSMQKEATLEFIAQPSKYMAKMCAWCGLNFGTSYKSVQYCSDSCRGKSFKAQTGVDWGFSGKSQVELWGGEPPRIINPTLWRNLRELVGKLAEIQETNPEWVVIESERQQTTETENLSLEPQDQNEELSRQVQEYQDQSHTPDETLDLHRQVPPVYEGEVEPQEVQEQTAHTNPPSSLDFSSAFELPEGFSISDT